MQATRRAAVGERLGDVVDVVGDRPTRRVEAGDAEEVGGRGDRLGGRCGRTQSGEEHGRAPAGCRGGVDPRTERLEAGRPAIRRFRREVIDGRPSAVAARELADADDRCAAVVDVGGAGGPGRGDAIVDDAGLDGGAEATRRLDLLEDVPRPLGELRR